MNQLAAVIISTEILINLILTYEVHIKNALNLIRVPPKDFTSY